MKFSSHFFKSILLFVLILTLFTQCKKDTDEQEIHESPYLNKALTYEIVKDVDGNKYATIKIGNQTWMAENLRVTKYNDGNDIPYVFEDDKWTTLTTGAYSVYEHSSDYESVYGMLYNWYAVNTGKLCPQGWRIPSDLDWVKLTDYLGGEEVAGGKMKTTMGWHEDGNGDNSSGFSGLPGGERGDNTGTFSGIGSWGIWWSTTESNINRYLFYANSEAVGDADPKEFGFSCRCVKD